MPYCKYEYWQIVNLGKLVKLHLVLMKKITRRVPLVEQELLSFLKHLYSYTIFSGICTAQYVVFCVMPYLFPFSFWYCIVCSFKIYGYWIPLLHLQTVPTVNNKLPNMVLSHILNTSLNPQSSPPAK